MTIPIHLTEISTFEWSENEKSVTKPPFLEASSRRVALFLNMNIWKTQHFLAAKRRKMRLNHERSFLRKSQILLPEWALSELHGRGLFKTFNSYSFNFNGGLRKRCTGYLLRTLSPKGKQFLWFLKIDLLRFNRIYLLCHWSKLKKKLMCLLRINLPNLWPNRNHFDAVDFTECHSEEVISFFWRSV